MKSTNSSEIRWSYNTDPGAPGLFINLDIGEKCEPTEPECQLTTKVWSHLVVWADQGIFSDLPDVTLLIHHSIRLWTW